MAQAKLSDAGNVKLGPLIHGWSLPAGKKFTCPGETLLCKVRCYAKRGHYHHNNVKRAHHRNWEFSKTPEFVEWMLAALLAQDVRIMRVHVAGDFYDVPYVQKWLQIVKQRRQTRFFAYTRSWREDDQFPELVRLSQLPNFSMWWSMDRATGPAPLIRGVRRAYMAIDDVDASLTPDDCDLVFRDQQRTVMKKANGVQVCPPENGVKTKVKLTCSRCGICWNDGDTRWENELLSLWNQDGEPQEVLAPAA